jgi:hypothetical protein
MSLEIRAVIHFLWLRHTPSQAIHSEFGEMYATEVMRVPGLEKWTNVFESGRIELLDLPKSGSPSGTEKIEAVRALTETRRYLSEW